MTDWEISPPPITVVTTFGIMRKYYEAQVTAAAQQGVRLSPEDPPMPPTVFVSGDDGKLMIAPCFSSLDKLDFMVKLRVVIRALRPRCVGMMSEAWVSAVDMRDPVTMAYVKKTGRAPPDVRRQEMLAMVVEQRDSVLVLARTISIRRGESGAAIIDWDDCQPRTLQLFSEHSGTFSNFYGKERPT